MSETKPPFGQPDIVRFSDEDAWGRRSMLRKGSELVSPVDFTIPHCVAGIEETVAPIRSRRDKWLRAQAAAKAPAVRECA